MHDAMGVGVGGHSSPIYDFLRIPGIASCIWRVGEEDTHVKIMTSSKFHEMHHAMGVGVGAHSSQNNDFLRFQGNASCIGGRYSSLMYDFLKIP